MVTVPEARMARTEGWVRRWNWRTRHRIGPGHDRVHGSEMRSLLRQMSWRRAF